MSSRSVSGLGGDQALVEKGRLAANRRLTIGCALPLTGAGIGVKGQSPTTRLEVMREELVEGPSARRREALDAQKRPPGGPTLHPGASNCRTAVRHGVRTNLPILTHVREISG